MSDINQLTDDVISEIDSSYYLKCKKLNDLNISPNDLGITKKLWLPFTSAVTELANMDNFKTELEKIFCLCNTFDFIYADIKFAMIQLFSLEADNDFQIPIIENDEIVNIFCYVIIKTKPLHLFSVICLLENYLASNKNYETEKNIFKIFKTSVKLLNKFQLSTDLNQEMVDVFHKEIEFTTFVKLSMDYHKNKNTMEIKCPLQIRNNELLDLIIKATRFYNMSFLY